MTEPILAINDLHVEFRGKRRGDHVRAVDGISLEVLPGEVVSLVGESGCGKTTTANAVLGLVPPAKGHITVGEIDIATADRTMLKQARSKMQMIAQDPYESLNPRMTIEDIVSEPLVVHGHGGDLRRAALDALAGAGLAPAEEFIDRRPHELSGGQRQRVVIAAALSIEPGLLIADEPVSMLDVSVRAGILNLLRQLADEKGIGVLLITHDLATVAAYADRIAVMYLGKIVESGPTLDIISDPEHPYTRALLSVVPAHDPTVPTNPTLLVGETPDASNIPSGCRFHPRCPAVFEPCDEIEPALMDTGTGRQCACLLYTQADSPA
ncbi:MAG TPA: ABC transporter ATP-binding protein [Acidimicrobiia bacterium]|nr:ABC transporter ATP-binding protein [Acidimicrobiia bacterium]